MGSQEEKILYSLGSTVVHPCWLVVPTVLLQWGRGYRGETSKVSENPLDYLHHCFLCSKPSTVRLMVSDPVCKEFGKQHFSNHIGKNAKPGNQQAFLDKQRSGVTCHVTDPQQHRWVLEP